MYRNEEYGDPEEPGCGVRIIGSTIHMEDLPSPLFFHYAEELRKGPGRIPSLLTLPVIQYIPCRSTTTLLLGPAATKAPMRSSFGPAN
jgi:hypothetical protein